MSLEKEKIKISFILFFISLFVFGFLIDDRMINNGDWWRSAISGGISPPFWKEYPSTLLFSEKPRFVHPSSLALLVWLTGLITKEFGFAVFYATSITILLNLIYFTYVSYISIKYICCTGNLFS